MFFLRTASLSVAIVMFLPGGAWSSRLDRQATAILRAAPEMDFTLEGTVNSLDHNKLTVHTEENIIFHVNYDDKTEFKDEDGKPAHSTDLRVGSRIRVEGDLAESGEIAAQRITLLKAPPPK
ncbi:MAG: DUF5666 domain-containing protein [Terriglobia bacterium]|jgi:uncharacterized protein DUF5666